MTFIPRNMDLRELDQILNRLVERGLPDGGEFLIADLRSDQRTASLIALLIWHGFLPMAGGGQLLPKIHKKRCILESPSDVHIGRKVRRRAKGFHLTVDTAWSEVVRGIQELTYTRQKGDCWLSDAIAAAYQAVNKLDSKLRRGVAFHSIELWHTASGKLVAGEIGYTCGKVYSSCTGFAMKTEYPGMGSVQMAGLGRWLARCGFAVWDLGMELDYKLELGGRMVSRADWIRRIRALRGETAALVLPAAPDADAHRLLTELEEPLEAEASTKDGAARTAETKRKGSAMLVDPEASVVIAEKEKELTSI
mmetsp:Transcript_36689/g.80424  ORF Transcript_36689/g.80424 Transcript_36689/m.80424 type:complete len:308 (-) Transcript_36689:141-1064(-)|eukprot:CAMPEP_0170593030 /NCGR_PEP_ID=MMETSP0224-20130122/13229_1 /TAXON_ID=285029 /ORGANISM="Togula jolla, Strain CCCM 725" /LENGTH=307 /DNA_ID=CAMNT_0010916953 /DNA_START=69 /DNA_END=992 /DNA_ORIENTATION=+